MMGSLFDLLSIFEKIAVDYLATLPSNVAKVVVNQ